MFKKGWVLADDEDEFVGMKMQRKPIIGPGFNRQIDEAFRKICTDYPEPRLFDIYECLKRIFGKANRIAFDYKNGCEYKDNPEYNVKNGLMVEESEALIGAYSICITSMLDLYNFIFRLLSTRDRSWIISKSMTSDRQFKRQDDEAFKRRANKECSDEE